MSDGRSDARALQWVLAAMVAIALGTAATRSQANPILGLMAIGLVIVAFQRYLLAWPVVLGYVVAVILFVPIRRYTVGGGLPFQIEPYRLLIAVVLFAWLLAVLVDPRTRWRRMRVEGPVLAFLFVVATSLALNLHHVVSSHLTGPVLKQLSFLASFLLVMYFVSSVVTTRRHLDRLIVLMVGGGTLLAVSALIEWRTNYNLFNHIQNVVPVFHLSPDSLDGPGARGFRVRAFASAQHPIALAAALILLLPMAIYLYRRQNRPIWMGAAALLTMGALATGSRTAVLMLMTELVAFLWMKRAETVRLLPLLVPLLVACQIVMPGTLGTFKSTIFPEQGLITEQQGGGESGSGRVADLAPGLKEFSRKPFFGTGFGTRLTSEQDPLVNARILDNQWLGLLIEIGALGVLALLWLYGRTIRRLGAVARRDDTDYGWLMTGLAAAIAGFAASMFTFDAFAFIQVTFMSYILLGFAAVALRLGPQHGTDEAPREEHTGPSATAVALRMRSAVASWVTPSTSSATGGAASLGAGGALALSTDRHMTAPGLSARRPATRPPLPPSDLARPDSPPPVPTPTRSAPAPSSHPDPAERAADAPGGPDVGAAPAPVAPSPRAATPGHGRTGTAAVGALAAASALRWIVRSLRR